MTMQIKKFKISPDMIESLEKGKDIQSSDIKKALKSSEDDNNV